MNTELIALLGAIIAIIYAVLKPRKELKVNADNVPFSVLKWRAPVIEFANKFGVKPEIIIGQIWTESAGRENAKGLAGEIGLMQLKPIAIQDIKENYPGENFSNWQNDPEQNIKAGTAFLALQKKRTGSLAEAIKAYNQGQKGKDLYPERANEYLQKVLNKAGFFKYV